METFHFPVRTYAQWEMKIRISYEARSSANLNVYSGLRAGVALLEAGRLHEAYEELALDDDQVEAGVREGRLVVDRRLQRFLAGLRERSGAGAGPSAGLGDRADALARAINAHGHQPVRDPKLESLRARAKEGDKAVKRLRQLEGKRWVRAGERVESAATRARRGRRAHDGEP